MDGDSGICLGHPNLSHCLLFLRVPTLCCLISSLPHPPSCPSPPNCLSFSLWNPGFYEDPSSTGGPDSPPSTFCGDSGFSGSGSYGRLGPSEPRGIYASERPKSLGKGGGVGPGEPGHGH
uniref:Uncharacterized protein n=1 Tax=Sus scrofa TaxID=9823 RepID=A0A8D0Q007_PIG